MVKCILLCSLKEMDTDEPFKKSSPCDKSRPVSLLQRLQDLKQELTSQQEEDRVCDLKLKCLLDIVDA